MTPPPACEGLGHTTTAMHGIQYTHIGRVGVGWQRHDKTCRSLRELDSPGTVFFFFGDHPQLVVELDHLCEVKNL